MKVLTEYVPLIDATMEMKNSMLAGRVKLEEIAQMTDAEVVGELEVEYRATIEAFDSRGQRLVLIA